MTNLLEETIEVLNENGHGLSEIIYVICDGDEVPIPDFLRLANIQYDNDYGAAEINMTLKVVGAGWWLERAEYDGSEWWDYREVIKKPSEISVPKSFKI